MDYTIDDLVIEIRNFRREGFKFWIKLLLHSDTDLLERNQVIYGEITAIKEEEKSNYESDYQLYYPYHLLYISRLIDASEIVKFLSTCYYYQQVQFMKKKDVDTILEKFTKYEEEEVIKFLLNSDLAFSVIDTVKISLENLNYNTKIEPLYSSPIDYSIEKDSTTTYYQIDFSARTKSLDNFKELENITENYYHTIFDLIFDKFSKNLRGNGSRLQNKLLFIFTKSHRGKVEIDIIDNKLLTKINNIESEKLLLQFKLKD